MARERGWCRQQVWDCALLGADAGDGRTSDRSGSRVGLGLVRHCPRRCRSWGLWWVCDGRVLFLLIVVGAWSQCWACAVGLALRVPPGCCYACREAGCASVRGCCASVGPCCLGALFPVAGRFFSHTRSEVSLTFQTEATGRQRSARDNTQEAAEWVSGQTQHTEIKRSLRAPQSARHPLLQCAWTAIVHAVGSGILDTGMKISPVAFSGGRLGVKLVVSIVNAESARRLAYGESRMEGRRHTVN